jgi:mycobactin phenyloxazoline synthetase
MFAARTVSALTRLLSRREHDSRRLDAVAEIYLEVAGMDAEEVLSQSAEVGMAHDRR